MSEKVEREIIRKIKLEGEVEVNSLVTELANKLSIEPHLVARNVYKLWKEEKLKLEDPEPPKTILRYITSTYTVSFWLIILMVTLTFLTIYVLPQKEPYIYLRYVLGSILVLYLPGQSLIEALYPKKEDLTSLERFALSIGLSLALVPLIGLILNYTPWGIRLNPIFTSISLLTLILTITATVRKYKYHKMRIVE